MLAARQNLSDDTKQSATDTLKTSSRRANQKAPEATSDLIGNKIADKITKVSRILPQNSSETVRNEAQNFENDIYLQKKTANY